MGELTKIQWCHHTMNPWRGCTKVSAGCANCYAEKQAKRNPGVLGIWGSDGRRVVASESYWRQPLAWNRAAEKAGERRRVFCASMADVLETLPQGHQDEEALEGARRRLVRLIGETPALDWLLLTKRPRNAQFVLPEWRDGWPRNVWLGVSVEDQATADERIPLLLQAPAAVRFLSCEPLLGPLNLDRWLNIAWQCSGCREYFAGHLRETCPSCGRRGYWTGSHAFNPTWKGQAFPRQAGPGVNWVIVGGESGPGARPFDVTWARGIVAQCQAAGVAVFVKQLGARPFVAGVAGAPDWPRRGRVDFELGRTWGVLDDSKGGDPAEFPPALRVREFPVLRP